MPFHKFVVRDNVFNAIKTPAAGPLLNNAQNRISGVTDILLTEEGIAQAKEMAQKAKLFHDHERYTAILRASEPWECKDLGRHVNPFDAKAWSAVSYEVVKTANRAKFEQNPELMEKLLATGDALLAEASPKDTIWGIGLDAAAAAETDPDQWPGQNLMGKILMELRAEFGEQRGGGAASC